MNFRRDFPRDLLRPYSRANPYEVYAKLTGSNPYRSDDSTFWVGRYEDVKTALNQQPVLSPRLPTFSIPPERFLAPTLGSGINEGDSDSAINWLTSRWILLSRADEYHSVIKGFLALHFLPGLVDRMRDQFFRFRSIVETSLADSDRVDLVSLLIKPSIWNAVCDVLGIDTRIRREVDFHMSRLAHILDPFIGRRRFELAEESGARLIELVKDECLWLKRVSGHFHDHGVKEPDIIANVIFLLIASTETTAALMANGIRTILNDVSLLDSIGCHPDNLPVFVEELIRLEPSVQLVGRTISEPVKLGELQLEKGQDLVLVLAAANRDPSAFKDPAHLFRRRETAKRHLSFGNGAHYCLGSGVARSITQDLVRAMCGGFLSKAKVVQTAWTRRVSLRALEALVVTTQLR